MSDVATAMHAISSLPSYDQQPYKELRSLLREIVQDKFTLKELKTFHWELKLPKRLIEENEPSIAILHVLEERNIIVAWSNDPTELIKILEQTFHRNDLATKVQQWSAQWLSASLKPEVHMIREEVSTSNEENHEQCRGNSASFHRQSQDNQCTAEKSFMTVQCDCKSRKSNLESVNEEFGDTKVKSEPIEASTVPVAFPSNGEETTEFKDSSLVSTRTGTHDSLHRTMSVTSSGYFSDRGSILCRMSDVSSLTESWQEESTMSLSLVGRPASPTHSFKHEVSDLNRNSKADEGFEEQTGQFRTRASSLPSNAKAIRNQVIKLKMQKEVSTSSLSSDSSEEINMSGPSYSKQQSLSSGGDQSSSEGSAKGSQESVKDGSLRRMAVVCNTLISTKISVPLRKISADITTKRSMARTSDPFPASTDKDVMQYQLRFFSINFASTACALYIDVARDHLHRLKKQSKKSSTSIVEINIPELSVTVTVSILRLDSSSLSRDIILEKKFEKVSSKLVKLNKARDYLKGQRNYVTVTSFPNLLSLDKLDDYHHCQPQAEIMIQVDLDCST